MSIVSRNSGKPGKCIVRDDNRVYMRIVGIQGFIVMSCHRWHAYSRDSGVAYA